MSQYRKVSKGDVKGLMEQGKNHLQWKYGAVPLGRDETHDKVIGMMEKEFRGRVLDAPCGTGILADRLRKIGFEVSCCDINSSRGFQRMLKNGGKLFISLPNYLTIERRFRFLFTGSHSKITSHEALREIWKGDLSMSHLSPLGYPILKFIAEHYGFRIVQLEREKRSEEAEDEMASPFCLAHSALGARFVSEK